MRRAKLAGCVCLILLGLAGAWCTASARTQPPSPTAGGSSTPVAERPVDELRSALSGHRSPAVQQMRTAQEATRLQPAQTLRLAALLQKDVLFSHYGFQLEAVHFRNVASDLNSQGKPQAAQEAATKALALFQRAAEGCAPPPIIRKLHEELGRTEALVGEAHFRQQRWAAAQAAYERAFTLFASIGLLSGFRPETLGRYAESCARQVPRSRKRAPSKPMAPGCQAWLQRFVMLEGPRSPKAQAIAKHVPLAALGKLTPPVPQSRVAPTVAPDTQAFTLAMELYRSSKFAEAASAFQSVTELYPDSAHLFRARFWMGRSLAQSARTKEAREAFRRLVEDAPLTYYGMLAALESGESLQTRIASITPKATARDPALDACARMRVERAESFLAEGMGATAAEELQGLVTAESSPFSSPFLMYLAMLHAEAGDDAPAFQAISELLRRKHPGALTPFTLGLLFPPRHLELVQKHAAAQKLEPALVLSLMKQESSFRTTAVSDQGAVGLMQLLPQTAEALEKGVSTQLSQVEPNIRAGTKYLRYLLDYFCGNRALALAGYNAGMGRVRSWRAVGLQDAELPGFIESIPARETREYVSRIIRNHYWYSMLVFNTRTQPMEYFWSSVDPASPKTGRCAPVAAPAAPSVVKP